MSAQRLFRGFAIAFGALAVIPGYWAVRLKWFPAADFDVVGFLWVLQNLPRLTAVVMTAALAGAALYYWVRSMRA